MSVRMKLNIKCSVNRTNNHIGGIVVRTHIQKIQKLSEDLLINEMVIESGFNYHYARNNVPYEIVWEGCLELVDASKSEIRKMKRCIELGRREALELSKKRSYTAKTIEEW